MKFQVFQVKKKGGELVEGQIAMPESLQEAMKLVTEKRAFKLLSDDYLFKAKRRLVSKRSPILKLRVAELTPDQQMVLRKLGLLKTA